MSITREIYGIHSVAFKTPTGESIYNFPKTYRKRFYFFDLISHTWHGGELGIYAYDLKQARKIAKAEYARILSVPEYNSIITADKIKIKLLSADK